MPRFSNCGMSTNWMPTYGTLGTVAVAWFTLLIDCSVIEANADAALV